MADGGWVPRVRRDPGGPLTPALSRRERELSRWCWWVRSKHELAALRQAARGTVRWRGRLLLEVDVAELELVEEVEDLHDPAVEGVVVGGEDDGVLPGSGGLGESGEGAADIVPVGSYR